MQVRANKQPIGGYVKREPFTNHLIQLQKGDSVFVFSDGYADQFGGPKGKKFKYSALKELLTSNIHLEMSDLQSILFQNFENWKGDLEQVDDVCIIGLKV